MPTTVAERMAGMNVLRTRAVALVTDPDLRIRYKQWDAKSNASSDRKMMVARVRR
jgi:hypothetical protein